MTVCSAELLGIGGDGRRRNRTAELLPTARRAPSSTKPEPNATWRGRSASRQESVRGSLGVISSLGKSDEQAAQEMQTVSSACASSASG
jgi:hypothetical protein